MLLRTKGKIMDEIGGGIQKAKINLLLKEAFFGNLLMHLEIIPDTNTPTFATNGKYIKYLPAYAKHLTRNETSGVLAHEILHCVFKHHLERKGRDHKLWNDACVTGDSLVTMANGGKKPITQVVAGDSILGEQDGEIARAAVLRTIKKKDKILEIVFQNGEKLRCTPTHKILTERGYARADEITTKSHAFLVQSRGDICQKESENDDDHRACRKSQAKISAGGFVSPHTQSICRKENHKASQLEAYFQAIKTRFGLHSWNCGWRRNAHDSTDEGKILSSISNYLNHEFCFSGIYGSPQVLRDVSEKQQPKTILANRHKWLPNNRFTQAFASLFGYQKAARRIIDRIYFNSAVSKIPRETNTENGRYTPNDKRIQHTGIVSIRRLEKTECVFDLTTTTQSYIANNIIVHNCDYCINSVLVSSGFILPGRPLLDSRFVDMTTVQIYNILAAENPPKPKSKEGNREGTEKPGNDSKSDQGQGDQNQGNQERMSQASCGEVDDSPTLNQANGQEAAEQESKVWNQRIIQAAINAKMAGKMPAGLDRLITGLLAPKVSWKEILWQFVQEVAQDDYSFLRPNRKYISEGVFLPSLYNETSLDIVVAVDTSGSISQDDLNQAASEISDIQNNIDATVHVVYVDAEFEGAQEFIPGDEIKLEAKGGGGTDFIPAFEWVEKKQLDIACMIYLTDGYCSSFPKQEPDYPVLWITNRKRWSVPFGEIILMEN